MAVEIPVDPTLLDAGDHNGSTFYQHVLFHRAVRGEIAPEVTLMDGARAVAMGHAAQEAVKTGLPVTIDLPDQSGTRSNGWRAPVASTQ